MTTPEQEPTSERAREVLARETGWTDGPIPLVMNGAAFCIDTITATRAMLAYDREFAAQTTGADVAGLREALARVSSWLSNTHQAPGRHLTREQQDDLRTILTSVTPDLAGLQEALKWYGEQARLCRLIHSGGDAGRRALDADGGERARKALAALPSLDRDAVRREVLEEAMRGAGSAIDAAGEAVARRLRFKPTSEPRTLAVIAFQTVMHALDRAALANGSRP